MFFGSVDIHDLFSTIGLKIKRFVLDYRITHFMTEIRIMVKKHDGCRSNLQETR